MRNAEELMLEFIRLHPYDADDWQEYWTISPDGDKVLNAKGEAAAERFVRERITD
jgi:hypothetical protein